MTTLPSLVAWIPILGGGNSNIFYFHPYLGKMIQFDEHIFQMGWFNHQLRSIFYLLIIFEQRYLEVAWDPNLHPVKMKDSTSI